MLLQHIILQKRLFIHEDPITVCSHLWNVKGLVSILPFITVLAMNFNICLFLPRVTLAPRGKALVT